MANINYKINKKQDGSYIYAEAVVTNHIKAEELALKVANDTKMSKYEVMDILAKAFAYVQKEICEGNDVYLPATQGNALRAYPILDNATIRQGDKDADNQTIPVTAESLVNRASQFRVKIGMQVSTDYADITKQAHIQYNGEVTNIKNSATATPTTPSQEDEDERGV